MSSKSPFYPMPESQHFSDYGFDPLTHYFEVNFRSLLTLLFNLQPCNLFNFYIFESLFFLLQFLEEAKKHKSGFASSPDGFHFKLEKFVPADQETKARKKKTWWRHALFFWKRSGRSQETSTTIFPRRNEAVLSGPIPMELEAPRRRRREWSGPIGRSAPTSKYVERENPYVSLRDLNRLSLSSCSQVPFEC